MFLGVIMASRALNTFRRLADTVRSLRRDQSGATAIEFALLALPFAFLSFAILETTVSFTAQQVVSNAVDKISREVRTGQLTLANTTKNQFGQKICDEISVLAGSSCSGLVWDLQSYSSFADVPKEIPHDGNGDIDSTGFKYDPGVENSIVSLRVFYKWPVLIDVMQSSMSNLPDGKTLLYASVTWQNEPF